MPSQADVAVFDALKGKAPAKDAYPHAARWYAHIASFEAGGRKQFPKSQKDAASYVSGGKTYFFRNLLWNSLFYVCISLFCRIRFLFSSFFWYILILNLKDRETMWYVFNIF